MWEDNNYKIHIQDNSIRSYEKVMLTSGQCNLFMPMGFTKDTDGETAYYNCSGYAPISKFKIERTEDALYILEQTLIIFQKSVEYLITPRRTRITKDTVFYNKETGDVKMIYVPIEGDNCYVRKSILKFMADLSRDICDGYGRYFEEIAGYVCKHNYYFREIIMKIEENKRKIYAEKERQKKVV